MALFVRFVIFLMQLQKASELRYGPSLYFSLPPLPVSVAG